MRAMDRVTDEDGNDLRKTPVDIQFGSSNSGTVVHALYRCGGGRMYKPRCSACTSGVRALSQYKASNMPDGYEFSLCQRCIDRFPEDGLVGAEVVDTDAETMLRLTDPEAFAEAHCPEREYCGP